MASPCTAVSDIEREEHDKTYGVKKTRIYGYDGTNLVGIKTDSEGNLQIDVQSGLVPSSYDYISAAYNDGTFTEVYTFKTGGAGGTTVATVTVIYTDASKDKLVTITKT